MIATGPLSRPSSLLPERSSRRRAGRGKGRFQAVASPLRATSRSSCRPVARKETEALNNVIATWGWLLSRSDTCYYSFKLPLLFLPIINKWLHSTVTQAQLELTWWTVDLCFAVWFFFFFGEKKGKILLVDSQQRLLNCFVPVLPSAFYWAVWRHSTLSISVKVVTAAPLSDEHKHPKKKTLMTLVGLSKGLEVVEQRSEAGACWGCRRETDWDSYQFRMRSLIDSLPHDAFAAAAESTDGFIYLRTCV